MALGKQSVLFGLFLLSVYYACAYPAEPHNPSLEYELINVGPQVNSKPALVPMNTTRTPIIINTPPPVDPNSKTFAFNPISKTWTLVKRNDPAPAEDTLLWNQGNDKWLTQTARV